MEVDIYLNKSVEQNAEMYYEQAKKAKKKLKGAKITIENFENKLSSIKDHVPETKTRKVRKRHWFEKFRWFMTSTGFFVIGGRDAMTNEIIIKKHTLPDDLVFHTDMAGSPFFILKTEKKEVDEKTLREVADATCSFSRAWKNGLSTTSVFYVKPDQVTKEANTGEYLTKGAFMIRGKTNYVDNKINVAIGAIEEGEYEGAVMCGPKEAVDKYCEPSFVLKQGDNKPSDVAKKIRKELQNSVDDIIRAMPPGNSELKKERKRK